MFRMEDRKFGLLLHSSSRLIALMSISLSLQNLYTIMGMLSQNRRFQMAPQPYRSIFLLLCVVHGLSRYSRSYRPGVLRAVSLYHLQHVMAGSSSSSHHLAGYPFLLIISGASKLPQSL